ncbi:MAG: diguanylate cyclase, partial [Gammaproteobacteria bacterium]
MRGHTLFLLTILSLATLLAGASTDARAARLVATTVIDAREPVQQPVIDWLAEADSPYSIDDLLSGAGAANWQSIPSTETSFGYTTTPYWFRLTLRNPHDTPSERYLAIPLPYMDDIRVWQTDGERIISEVMLGERLPYDARLIDHPFFIIPITLPPQTAHTWLFRLQTQGSMEFPIEVWQPQAFWEAQTRYQQGLALFYGFLLLGLTLTVLLWARLRESLYGFYILFLASALLLMAAQHGHTFRYLWPTHPDIQNLILFWAVPLCTIGAIEFSRRFLRLRKHVRPFDKLLAGLTWLNVAHLGLVPVLPASWALQQAVLLGMLASVLLAIAGPLVLMHRQPGALSYNIGWLFLATSVLINGLQKFGWLPANHFTLHALLYGIGAQSALLTFGLVDRLYRERTRRIRAEQANVRLEQERAQAAENHLHAATHDPVTGLPNRSVLVEALQRKIDEGEPVGILLVRFNRLRDIDRTLGQAHADVVVTMAAERLRNESILLPDTQPLTGQNGESIARLNGSTFALLY